MAYNYYQPMGYQPMFQNQYQQMQGQPFQQPQMPQMTGNNGGNGNGIIWIDGYSEAAMYPVAPNAAVALWDKTAPSIYLKKADATGKPSMQIFDLVERKDEPKPAPQQPTVAQGVEFATKTDLNAVSEAVEVLRKGFDEMRLKIENSASKKGAKLNE